MSARIQRSHSTLETERDYFNRIKDTLSDVNESTIKKAQELFDRATDDCIWESPMGDSGCSFLTHSRSVEKNYYTRASQLIREASKSLVKQKLRE